MRAVPTDSAPLAGLARTLGKDPDPLDTIDAFATWAHDDLGVTLYDAQVEALTALAMGSHVVLSTPTGTGKSLVAAGAHLLALTAGERTVYTAPIKALVSEKFFDLVAQFGPHSVGMMTGDSSINPGAPILCCTAEILANIALGDPDAAGITSVVMDEFHYYGDKERGWAWQVPLLTMPNAQFTLMSATLGDVSDIVSDLGTRTGRDVEQVTGVTRPVPLSFEYVRTPVHETVERMRDESRTPTYLVNFSQIDAVAQAQALSSVKLIDKDRRAQIAEALGDFKFGSGFGEVLSRYVRAGIGVHHAGLLPKYRRLVERLAQQGLLSVISGTDTLGIGINVPIRSVVLTALVKFDGHKMRRLTAREFHQIAGRAGRAGFDTEGYVYAIAPEHEIENAKAAAKAQANPKKKAPKKKQPQAGTVTWTEDTLNRLHAAQPEALTSRMRITHAMVLEVIGRGEEREGEAFSVLRDLVFANHEPLSRQRELARTTLSIVRTLLNAGIIERRVVEGRVLWSMCEPLQQDFALNQPLSPFALAALELLDAESDTFALDAVSIIEATLEDPRAILRAQEREARDAAMQEMKLDGVDYHERLERLEEITYPKPLAQMLDEAFRLYVAEVPWARDYYLRPKSVIRLMRENAMSFRDLVSRFGLLRQEGVVLRYLSEAYRALSSTIPAEKRTSELEKIISWLRDEVTGIDSSLLDEWQTLADLADERASESHERD